MKIYFEDDYLVASKRSPECDYRIDAAEGVSSTLSKLEYIAGMYPDYTVYTNSLLALDGKYCWNQEKGYHELYIRGKNQKEFVRVDSLTDKELRQPHNLMMMYLNGAFDV